MLSVVRVLLIAELESLSCITTPNQSTSYCLNSRCDSNIAGHVSPMDFRYCFRKKSKSLINTVAYTISSRLCLPVKLMQPPDVVSVES